MLKTNQKNVHAFEIEKQEPEAVMEFLEKNHALLQYFLIIFKYDIEPEVKAVLHKHQLLFLETNRVLNGRYIKTTEKDANLLKQNSPNAIEPKTTIYERNIRSGEEIYSANHLIFLGNIHNGAKIISEGSVSVYGVCEGAIVCFGEYLILKEVKSAQIVFQNKILSLKEVERLLVNKNIKIITKNDDILDIKEVL
ncbi:septum site-determining protein MinC [Helicobacter pylori]|uniref:septum site-determining protein MinC n=2 Tax=Helicobacter pylori TaxID=210 RepID=UPI000BECC10F|nr:septum site-determining protein MinC [Helicobacter pylori]PDW50798.1 septum site-determining protein MinC [Helicobacter pylori]PDW90333.1 septum site-determining protein MinC [Helicobacter pylori]WQU62756.1 septum site-determining protein MinC [Helicobacter pylori]WQU71402.1 septum site-determining protein MinC [Helicobacter pylori]WQU75738.1 septum site-determining protein MinC [Helicobacter pylori]